MVAETNLVEDIADSFSSNVEEIAESVGEIADSVEEIAESLASNPVDVILHEPVLWSMAVMLSIVALLQAWEEAIHKTRKTLPDTLMPVVDSMLAEVSGLGFIGVSVA